MAPSSSSRPRLLLLPLLLLVLACEARSPFLRLNERGGYEDVVVALSHEAAADDGQDADDVRRLVDGVKALFTAASKLLHTATRHRVHFSRVTVLLPDTWRHLPEGLVPSPPPDSDDDNATTSTVTTYYESYDEADFRVDGTGQGEDAEPDTVQARGCGGGGEVVQLTGDFVRRLSVNVGGADNDRLLVNAAKSVVREWARYRYGVFDECGTSVDPIHPAYYYAPMTGSHRYEGASGEPIAPTGCFNTGSLPGQFTGSCQLNRRTGLMDPNCDFIPSSVPTDAITSSLMFMPFMPKVDQFCDAASHNSLAPTKQNTLCRERSVWEVILESKDFNNLRPNEGVDTKPTFKVARAANTSYSLLLDVSASMDSKGQFNTILASLRSFGQDHLPTGSAVSLLPFPSSPSSSYPWDSDHVTAATRTIFRNMLPSGTAQEDEDADVAGAISAALARVTHQGPRVLLLVTGGRWSAEAQQRIDTDHLCANMTERQARLEVLLYASEPVPPAVASTLQTLARCSQGEVHVVGGEGADDQTTAMADMEAALRHAVVRTSGDEGAAVQVHAAALGHSEQTRSGHFNVDEGVGRDTDFAVGHNDTSQSPAEVTLVSPDGRTFSRSSQQYYAAIERQRFGFKFQGAIKSGRWSYNITRAGGGRNSNKVLSVAVTSRAREGDDPRGKQPIRVTCWTDVGKRDVDGDRSAVVVYARVSRRRSVLINATVEATVRLPVDQSTGASAGGGSGGFDPRQTITLRDDGSGDPDVTSFDGIYSAYFTSLPRPGLYSVRVRLTNQHRIGRLRTDKAASNPGQYYGCRRPMLDAPLVGPIERWVTCGSFHVANPTGLGSDPHPPARVSDLRLDRIDVETGTAFVSWTAVGDDFNSGTVSGYEVSYATDRRQLTVPDRNHQAKMVLLDSEIVPPHSKQTTRIRLPERGRLYYVAVRGVDDRRNRAPTSNVIAVQVPTLETPTPKPPPPPLPSFETDHDGHDAKNKTTGDGDDVAKASSVSVGTIVGIVIAALLILVIVAIVLMVTSNRRKRAARQQIAAEKKRSSLLRNAPPPSDPSEKQKMMAPPEADSNHTRV